jgi:hypothetical protein
VAKSETIEWRAAAWQLVTASGAVSIYQLYQHIRERHGQRHIRERHRSCRDAMPPVTPHGHPSYPHVLPSGTGTASTTVHGRVIRRRAIFPGRCGPRRGRSRVAVLALKVRKISVFHSAMYYSKVTDSTMKMTVIIPFFIRNLQISIAEETTVSARPSAQVPPDFEPH